MDDSFGDCLGVWKEQHKKKISEGKSSSPLAVFAQMKSSLVELGIDAIQFKDLGHWIFTEVGDKLL